MSDESHPFARLTSGHHERQQQAADAAFEEGRVGYLMREFRLNAREVGAELRRLAGGERMTLAAWDQAFPTFPIRLAASRLGGVKLHTDPSALFPSLIQKFPQARFVTAYDAVYEREGQGAKPVGLVFPRKGIRHGMVVYATADFNALPLARREAFLAYAAGDKTDRHWVLVRSFQKLVEAVHNGGHGWRPD